MKRLKEIGPSSRSRRSQSEYKKYQKIHADDASCAFCSDDKVIVQETFEHFRLLENRFKYDVWDDYRVIEHLMIAPKRHIATISELNAEEKTEYLNLLAQFEENGYSIYSRAPVDVTRSADHLHTHFIRLGKHQAKGMIYIRKPHFVTYFFGKNE